MYLKKVIEIISDISIFEGNLYAGKLTGFDPLTLESIAVSGNYGAKLDDAYRGTLWRKNSLAVKAIKSKEFVWTEDYKRDEKLNKDLGITYDTRSCGTIPIIKNKKIWGIISIASPEPNIFTDEIINIVKKISGYINKKLYEIYLKKSKVKAESSNKGLRKEIKLSREIEKQKKSIENINRYYKVLAFTNELIIKERNETKLFKEICRIISEIKEISFAWIGLWNGASVV